MATTRKKKILVADDDRLVLVTLADGLRNEGYEVMEASDGAEAIALGLADPPDLAILDYRMPNGLGAEVAKRLREEAGVPSIFLSAYDDDDILRLAVEQGALGYLVKPVHGNQVLPAVEIALERAAELERLRTSELNLISALKRDRDISTAVGMIMERLKLSEEDAFATLHDYGRSKRRKLAKVARELLDAANESHGLFSEIEAFRTNSICPGESGRRSR